MPRPASAPSPLSNKEVQFLLRRGFALEQVERGSQLALPVNPEKLAHQLSNAEAKAGSNYSVHRWLDRTPERWREDLAVLCTRMTTDAPTGRLAGFSELSPPPPPPPNRASGDSGRHDRS
ncbi:hypothetical protein ABIB56_003453 [Glaciihabitans sp. UYNi722]